MSRRRLAPALITLVTAGAVALTGCSSSGGSKAPAGGTSSGPGTSSPVTSSSPPTAALKPLVVGVNVPYAPNEFLDSNNKVVGFDVDLLNAVANKAGYAPTYRQADFDKIVPAVAGGTYDIGMSSFTDNKQREQTVDFVDYFTAGYLWASAAGKTVDPANACGLTVSVQSGTVEQTDELPALSKACTSAGKKAIKVLPYKSQDDATNALVLGKVDAMSADSPITAYAIKQTGGKLQQAGDITESAPYGWPFKKGSPLIAEFKTALQALIDNGTYDTICKKWGVQSGEIKTAVTNGATS